MRVAKPAASPFLNSKASTAFRTLRKGALGNEDLVLEEAIRPLSRVRGAI